MRRPRLRAEVSRACLHLPAQRTAFGSGTRQHLAVRLRALQRNFTTPGNSNGRNPGANCDGGTRPAAIRSAVINAA